MKKFVLTEELVEALSALDDEISAVMVASTNIVNSDEVEDDELDELDYIMGRVIEAWEEVKKVERVEIENGNA